MTPSAPSSSPTSSEHLRALLPFSGPLEPSNLYGHLAATAVPGVEEWRDGAYRAAVRLPHGPAIVRVGPPSGEAVPVNLLLADAADAAEALRRVRLAFDLDLDASAAAGVLAADPVLAPLVGTAPGRRAPGTLDAEAMVLKAVLGQQISTTAARTHAARLAARFGDPVGDPEGGITRLFPSAERLAGDAPAVGAALRLPEARRRSFQGVAAALADGRVDLTAAPGVVRAALLELPGIGPWTADTVLMRALGDADAFLPTDLGVVAAARRLGLPDRPRDLLGHAERWRPFRSHAVQYLWATGEHPVNRMPA